MGDLGFARVLSDSVNVGMSDCETYGMTYGCDEHCPVFMAGECTNEDALRFIAKGLLDTTFDLRVCPSDEVAGCVYCSLLNNSPCHAGFRRAAKPICEECAIAAGVLREDGTSPEDVEGALSMRGRVYLVYKGCK